MRNKVALYLSFLLMFACRNADMNKGKSVFNYNEPAGISSLDPAFARDQSNIWAINQMFNGLVQFDDSLHILPCIASSWKISESGDTYVFQIRSDVFFHDDSLFLDAKGRRVVASDFVYSLERLRSPMVNSSGAWIMNYVRKDAEGVSAPNDTTLVIKLNQPFAPFLGMLATQYCSVVPKEVVSHYGKDFRTHPVGTGPFRFSIWKETVKLVMIKNERYFESDSLGQLPHLDAISVSFIANKESGFLEFLRGKYDFVSGIDGAYKDQLLTREGTLQKKFEGAIVMTIAPYLNTEYLGFLVDRDPKNPLMKKEVRQAINYGFDRRKMISFLRNNIGIPANSGFVPQGILSFDDKAVQGYEFDQEKARKLLSKAGYPGGQGLPEIVLSVTPSYADYCEFIQGQLAEIGLKIKLETNQGAVHREFVAKSKLKFFRGSWIADYPDAESFLSLFYSKNFCPTGPNYTHFSSAKYDEMYLAAIRETSDDRRNKLYQEMDKLLVNECPFVVLYYDQSVRLTKPNIKGLGANPMNLLTLKRVVKEPLDDSEELH